MPVKQYRVELTTVQRSELARVVRTGTQKVFTRRRVQIWLWVDQGPEGAGDTDPDAADRLECSAQTVYRAWQVWEHLGMTGLQTVPWTIRAIQQSWCQPGPPSACFITTGRPRRPAPDAWPATTTSTTAGASALSSHSPCPSWAGAKLRS